jgi:hypothetical protein
LLWIKHLLNNHGRVLRDNSSTLTPTFRDLLKALVRHQVGLMQ